MAGRRDLVGFHGESGADVEAAFHQAVDDDLSMWEQLGQPSDRPCRENILPNQVPVMTTWTDRIVVDPEILVGKPIIKGTRISVELIMDGLADGWTLEDITTAYPRVTRDDVLAAIAFVTEVFREEHGVALRKLSP